MVWSMRQLGDICEILDRKRKPITKRNRKPGPYPYYGATGILDYVADFIFDDKLVLIGEDGAKWGAGDNSAFKVSGKVWVNNHAHVLKPKSEIILDDWIVYYLNFKDLSDYISGMTVPKLNQGQLKQILIPVPPLEEQKRIVTMLDEAFADIKKAQELTEQNLKNARELFDSYLSQTFESRTKEWHKQKFGEVCHFVRGPFGGALKKSIFKPEGFAVYEQQHAIYDQFQDIRYFVDGEKFEQMSRFELLPGDLIISCSGTMGKIAIAPPNIKRGIINQALLKLTPKPGITAQFLKIWMESPNFQREIESRAQGAAIKNMASVKVLKDIFIPIPSAVVQHEIVDLHDRLKTLTSSLESNYMTKLSELSKLKESILSQQFQGV